MQKGDIGDEDSDVEMHDSSFYSGEEGDGSFGLDYNPSRDR